MRLLLHELVGVGEEVVDHPVEESGELLELLRRPVGQRHLHTADAGFADPAYGLLADRRQLDALGATVVRVGYAGDVAGLLELLDLPGDVGGLDAQPVGQLSRAQRLGVGDLPQQGHGGTVQRYAYQAHQTLVRPGPSAEVGDASEGSLDLDHFRGGGVGG